MQTSQRNDSQSFSNAAGTPEKLEFKEENFIKLTTGCARDCKYQYFKRIPQIDLLKISQPINGDSDMIVDDEIDEPELTNDLISKFQPPPTSSGRQRHFPRHYQDFLPSLTTNIPHMPPKQSVQLPLHTEPHPPNI